MSEIVTVKYIFGKEKLSERILSEIELINTRKYKFLMEDSNQESGISEHVAWAVLKKEDNTYLSAILSTFPDKQTDYIWSPNLRSALVFREKSNAMQIAYGLFEPWKCEPVRLVCFID